MHKYKYRCNMHLKCLWRWRPLRFVIQSQGQTVPRLQVPRPQSPTLKFKRSSAETAMLRQEKDIFVKVPANTHYLFLLQLCEQGQEGALTFSSASARKCQTDRQMRKNVTNDIILLSPWEINTPLPHFLRNPHPLSRRVCFKFLPGAT
jgi:hypothetical protein